MKRWVGCIAGAMGDYEYVAKLARPRDEAREHVVLRSIVL
jgi:hypothetical protein